MPIIDGQKQIKVHEKFQADRTRLRTGKRQLWIGIGEKENGHQEGIGIISSRKETTKMIIDDLALIQEHFGLSRSAAGRIALRLTAQAIRANRALPKVT